MICNLETTGIQSYIKLHGQERSQKKDLKSHLGIDLGTSCTEGHALANYAKKILNSSPEEGLDFSLRQKRSKVSYIWAIKTNYAGNQEIFPVSRNHKLI